MSTYLTLAKSTTVDPPLTSLFGQLQVTETAPNTLKMYLGDSSNNPVKIFDETTPSGTPVYIYNNTTYKTVSPNGLDTNNGQPSRPYQTITYGISQITAGGVLAVESATYTENITLNVTNKASQGVSNGISDAQTRIIGTAFLSSNFTGSKLSNLSFEKSDSQILVNGTGTSFFLDRIAVGTSVTSTNFLDITTMNAGYVNISNCDFNNLTLKFAGSNLVQVYIQNCRNFKIDAGATYLVAIDETCSFQEISTNNNVVVGFTNITDIVATAPTVFGYYLASAAITIGSLNILKGDLFLFITTGVAQLVRRYYNCSPIMYLSAKSTSYVKTGSLTWSPVTSYPIVL